MRVIWNGFLGLVILVQGLGCTHREKEVRQLAGQESKGSLSVFRISEKDDVKTWDPANAYDTVSLDLLPTIYETLYQYRYLSEVYTPEPLLAAEMPRFSKDKRTVTIPIKKGIYFQKDGCFGGPAQTRELKAQDFIYAIKRLALPSLQSGGWWTVEGKILGIDAFHEKLNHVSKSDLAKAMEDPIEGLNALDDYTLQFKFVQPYPQLLYVLSMSFTSPVAQEAIQKYADERGNLTDHPVGTGPFVLTHWERNHEVQLDRNSNYRLSVYPSNASKLYLAGGMLQDANKPMPFLDRILVSVMKEEQPRWLQFMQGQLDLITLPKDNFKQAIVNQTNLSPEFVKKGIHLSIETGVVIRYISFNMKDQILGTNKLLRQALSSAIDRDQWIDIFTNGTGKKMVNAIPPGIPDRPKKKTIKYDYNLVRAKSLLEKAGYPGGAGLPPLKFDLRGASTTDRQLGDFIQQQFSKIGVKVEVIPNTFPTFLSKLKDGNLQISFGGWSMDYPDAENVYQLLYGPNMAPGPGDANYNNPAFDRLYSQMKVMESGKSRELLTEQMEDLIQEDCPWAMGYYEASYFLSQPWFMNYRGSGIILNKYKYYRVDPEIQKRYQGL